MWVQLVGGEDGYFNVAQISSLQVQSVEGSETQWTIAINNNSNYMIGSNDYGTAAEAATALDAFAAQFGVVTAPASS